MATRRSRTVTPRGKRIRTFEQLENRQLLTAVNVAWSSQFLTTEPTQSDQLESDSLGNLQEMNACRPHNGASGELQKNLSGTSELQEGLATALLGPDVQADEVTPLTLPSETESDNLIATAMSSMLAGDPLIVTSNLDIVDSGDGLVTLCEAMTFANSNPGLDTISFDIPGMQLHTIQPLSPLPNITDPLVIDGFSQPGAAANTLSVGSDAEHRIELNGSQAGSNVHGLTVSSGGQGSTIKGLVVNRFTRFGINVLSHDNVIEGNMIGLNADGDTAEPNRLGVFVGQGHGNRIGGSAVAARNVISGNTTAGIFLRGSGSYDNTVQQNYIGLDPSGMQAFANGANGIAIQSGANNNTIGGSTATGNVIGGNANSNITLAFVAYENEIQGNLIGTSAIGNGPLGSGTGVLIAIAPTRDNLIGGFDPAQGNLIAYQSVAVSISVEATDNLIIGNEIVDNANEGIVIGGESSGNQIIENAIQRNGKPGIRVASGTGNRISRNSITANGNPFSSNGLGIDLDPFLNTHISHPEF